MDLSFFFHTGPLPPDAMDGHYNWQLVLLSYLIASLASYVALDITERIRTDKDTRASQLLWLFGGALAMGMGIWSMHFIGMLAFVMPMPMSYDPFLTVASLLVAVAVSAFAFFLIKNEQVKLWPLVCGGIALGLGVVTMHYMGMSAMKGMDTRYIPDIFLLSVAIALVACEAALWLMIQSSRTSKQYHNLMKVGSSLVMGFAICGMHYTGMEAAVFTHSATGNAPPDTLVLNPDTLSLYIGSITIVIISIALFASKSWTNALQERNKKLIETEAVLEQKSRELEGANKHLKQLIARSQANEGRIRAILTAAADGIIVTDEEGTIELCNQAAEKIFGYAVPELTSHKIFDFIALKSLKKGDGASAISLDALQGKEDALFELTVVRKDGRAVPIELNFSKSRINSEVLYIILLRDITERKLAEENLNNLNRKLMTTARMAGMAEVATCMLHNVGNVLNSINVSTQLLLQRSAEAGARTGEFARVSELLAQQRDGGGLETFLKTHRVGQILPEYLQEFSDFWSSQQNFSQKELETLNAKVQHVKSIVAMQQSLSGHGDVIEAVSINDLIEDALTINGEKLQHYRINVIRDFENLAPVEVDKVKMMQILVNLVKNATEALAESGRAEKTLTLRAATAASGHIQIEIRDNGLGIEEGNLNRIFSYGFTTKKGGHGFGLHSSALAIQQMGGSLKAYSDGPGRGANFVLLLPAAAKRESVKELHLERETALL